MKMDTAIQRKTLGKTRISDLFQIAIIQRMEAEPLHNEFLAINQSLGKIPHWVTSYLQGVYDTNIDSLYKNNLEFCYLMPDGKLYSIDKDSSRHYAKHGFEPMRISSESLVSGHYWKDSDKPFFASRNR